MELSAAEGVLLAKGKGDGGSSSQALATSRVALGVSVAAFHAVPDPESKM